MPYPWPVAVLYHSMVRISCIVENGGATTFSTESLYQVTVCPAPLLHMEFAKELHNSIYIS